MFGGFQFFPPVIKSLIIVNAIMFAFTYLAGSFHIGEVSLGVILVRFLGLMPLGYGFYPWQLITYQFMHADFWHIFFNMVFGLWMFGMEVENTWGSKKFLIYYLSCGVIAGLAQLILAPIFEPAMGPTIGASGAVYGVMVAFATLFPDRYIFLYFLIPIKVKYFIMGMIVLGVLSIGGPTNVANLAHLGGALGGYLYIVFERRRIGHPGIGRVFQSWTKSPSWQPPTSSGGEVVDAKVFDIGESKLFKEPAPEKTDQKKIDDILDKISHSGYQSLSEEEKKILFEASKRMN
jgi:membrane associated rhomboid family serine protease